jgi:hypothetical protein
MMPRQHVGGHARHAHHRTRAFPPPLRPEYTNPVLHTQIGRPNAVFARANPSEKLHTRLHTQIRRPNAVFARANPRSFQAPIDEAPAPCWSCRHDQQSTRIAHQEATPRCHQTPRCTRWASALTAQTEAGVSACMTRITSPVLHTQIGRPNAVFARANPSEKLHTRLHTQIRRPNAVFARAKPRSFQAPKVKHQAQPTSRPAQAAA